VGRLAKEKQQALLLRAIARSRFKESVELNIVGTGPRENELRRLARTLNINARIEAVSDEVLSKLYSEADLFVHTGEIELEGMSVMEAIASANTVLVSDSKDSAIARLVTDERARFTNNNVENLSKKIDYLLEHPEERQALATANREGVKNLSHSKSVVQLTSVYEALLADAKASVGITQIE
jgi:glycosyltransferase involved in cell wall biosynthesis